VRGGGRDQQHGGEAQKLLNRTCLHEVDDFLKLANPVPVLTETDYKT
jgi:hypothetical protein